MSTKERHEVKDEMLNGIGNLTDMFKTVDQELLLILRTKNLVRALNNYLGSPLSNLVAVIAKFSVKGIDHTNEELGWLSGISDWVHIRLFLNAYIFMVWIEETWGKMRAVLKPNIKSHKHQYHIQSY